MKKQLLLATAFASVLSLSAQSASKSSELVSERSQLVNSALLSADVAVAPTTSAATAAVQPADGDDGDDSDYVPLPLYDASGLFFDGIIADGDYAEYAYNMRYAYFPPFTKLAYQNTSYYTGTRPDSFSWEWSVPQVSDVDLSAGTLKYLLKSSTDASYTADFETAYFPYAVNLAPSLTMDGTTYKVGYTTTSGTEYYRSQWGGRRTNAYSNADDEHIYLTYYPANTIQAYKSLTSEYGVCNTLRITNWNLGAQFYSDVEDHLTCATLLNPADSRAYGFSKVVLKAYISSLAAGGKFKVDVYKISYDSSAKYWSQVYPVGEHVAEGYVATDEYAGATGTKFIYIPLVNVEGEGEDAIESETFYNVTEPVIVVVSLESAADASDTVLPFPVFAKGENTSRMWQYQLGGMFFPNMPNPTNSEETFASFYPTFAGTKTLASIAYKQIGWDMQFDLQYSYLFSDGSHPELTATIPAAGGSQSFTFSPSDDLYNAKFSTSDGSDWAYAYPDDEYVEYGTQKLVVEADALPSGVKGRATTLTVEIQGDVTTILVTQGDTSGIENIAADDANVVSTQIFDLQGRRLNAVPESGLYIRRDVNADNTVTTTKLSK